MNDATQPGARMASEAPPSFLALEEHALARFGRYEIIGELASGGMGVVYLARHANESGFQRLFAIKVMHEHLGREKQFVEMLHDEARLAARLHHPNVVPIIDLGEQDGRFFLVMDYIEGCSLSQLCKRHRRRRERPASKIVPLIIDALEGLHAAHTLVDDDDVPLNLVHRDMSSQNILVGVDGSARVIDFGIAKAEARITSTRPGILKGKLAYMAPEQLRDGAAIDARADIFAVGVVLWSALTGLRLFKGDSESVTIANVLGKDIAPPSTQGFNPPTCFDEVVLRALERDREKRFQTAADMADALRKAAAGEDCISSRSDIAVWVKSAFSKEFKCRREAIRVKAGNSAAISLAVDELGRLSALPSLTPASGDSDPSISSVTSSPKKGQSSREHASSEAATVVLQGRSGRSNNLLLFLAASALAVVILVLWRGTLGEAPETTPALVNTALGAGEASNKQREEPSASGAEAESPKANEPDKKNVVEKAAPVASSASTKKKPVPVRRYRPRAEPEAAPPPTPPEPAASPEPVPPKPTILENNPYLR